MDSTDIQFWNIYMSHFNYPKKYVADIYFLHLYIYKIKLSQLFTIQLDTKKQKILNNR